MSPLVYYIICSVLSVLVLVGISMLSKVQSSVKGNLLSAFCLTAGIAITLVHYEVFSIWTIYVFLLIGSAIGLYISKNIKMIQMPQTVALLNGIGGAASALVGTLSILSIGATPTDYPVFSNITAAMAIVVGVITLVGSLVAAGKLHNVLPQKSVVWRNHQAITMFMILGSFAAVVCAFFLGGDYGIISNPYFIIALSVLFSSAFGYAFAIRVGGADMPITISLLNSLSGVAGSIAGMAIGDILLVAVGGIVGASGLLLTQIMCRAMNRSLFDILLGKTSTPSGSKGKSAVAAAPKQEQVSAHAHKSAPEATKAVAGDSLGAILTGAKSAIIVPGYGMALAQAQHKVKQLADMLEKQGTTVRYAVHPVAGRMPGHMNVLLAEADVSYEQLYEMDAINGEFKSTDVVIVIGANDVLNPSARDAKDTPIYGMPVLNVDQGKHVIICNYDLKPGYSGVDNPLYYRTDGVVTMMLGDAKDSLDKLVSEIHSAGKPAGAKAAHTSEAAAAVTTDINKILHAAKSAIIVPGYGMALAQGQHKVKQMADMLEKQGTTVRYAVHPVAGRMPGHMNVLLAEADVSYEQLYEMDKINDDFKETDVVIVIGANDVLNPSARDAKDTPIYGMPVLNVDQGKHIIICNFDLKPGYSGVDNPLYYRTDGVVTMMLGDAKESLDKIIAALIK